MPTVRAGCTQHLPASDPFAVVAGDVCELARIVHNSFTYHFRQDMLTRERSWREAETYAAPAKFPRPLSATHLKALVRGSAHRDLRGQVVCDDPDGTRVVIGMLGCVWDRVAYEFQASVAGYWGSLRRWHARERQGTKPQLPGYHTAQRRHITYRAGWLHPDLSTGLCSFPRGKSPAAVSLPPLRIPEYVLRALRGGMARLVEVQLRPQRSGDVVVQWTFDETGREGALFPDAPTTLAEAIRLGPVGSIDVGVGNLLALTCTDLRSAPPHSLPTPSLPTPILPGPRTATPPPSALPGPLLVRGAAVEEECHRTGVWVAQHRSQLPFRRGGTESSASTTSTTSTTSTSTTSPAPPSPPALLPRGVTPPGRIARTRGTTTIFRPIPVRKKTKRSGRRQQRHSHAITARWAKHDLRTSHLVHASVQPILDELQAVGARALVLGWNEGIKQRLNLGRQQNGRFGTIPYEAIRGALRIGCARLGILYLEVTESYTSKTSFVDGELPVKQASYAGRRVTRGLFRTGSGVVVNADVNASLQILVRGLIAEGCRGALRRLTRPRREQILRMNLNPRSVHPDLGARTRAVPPTPAPTVLAA